jgi:hypothetical protein
VEATAVTPHEVGGCADDEWVGEVLFSGAVDTVAVEAVAGGRGCPTGCADSWDTLTTAATRTPRARMPSPPRNADTPRRFATPSGLLVAFIGKA